MCALISLNDRVKILPNAIDIIAFDLDGTLAPSKSPLQPEMAAVLVQVLQYWKIAVISGASFTQFQTQFLRNLPCPATLLSNLSILPTDGGELCRYTESQWHCKQDQPFTSEEKKKIEAAFEQAFTVTGFVKPEKTYGAIIEDRSTQITFSAFGMQAPLDVKKAWDSDHRKRMAMVAVLKPLLPGFAIHIGGSTSIDITRAGIDKAYGLRKLFAVYDISPERMLYIGDELFPDGNDAPALTVGALCIAVKGPEETKQILEGLLNKKLADKN